MLVQKKEEAIDCELIEEVEEAGVIYGLFVKEYKAWQDGFVFVAKKQSASYIYDYKYYYSLGGIEDALDDLRDSVSYHREDDDEYF